MTITAINIAATITSDPQAMATLGLVADFLPAILIGLIAWFFKKAFNDLDNRIASNTEKIEDVRKENEEKHEEINKRFTRVERDMAKNQEQAHREFVTKEEHAQSSSIVLKKLDTMMDYIVKLHEKLGSKGE